MLQVLLIWSATAAVLCLAVVASVIVAAAFQSGGRREYRADDRDTLAASRFTIPVSLIVPLDRDAPDANGTISALLGLHYSDFEVVVVADETAAAALPPLISEWDLSAHELFYRQSLTTAPVLRIYRSGRDARLMIVEKRDAGRADALNCGVNLARFRYAGVIDPRIVFDADALLRAMAAPLSDPAHVVAASSHVEVRSVGDVNSAASAAWQQLQSIRSFLDSRIAWRRLQHGLGPADGVVVWRRDALLTSGGFSNEATDPDLDMMVRLQAGSGGDEGSVIRTTEIFGRIEAWSVSDRLRRISRHQRAVLEAVRVAGPREGAFGRALTYLVGSQVLMPLLGMCAVVGFAAGAVVGWWTWREVALVALLMSISQAAVSSAALLSRGSASGTPDVAELTWLLVMSPLEVLVFGPIAACARISGVLQGLTAVGPKPFISSADKEFE